MKQTDVIQSLAGALTIMPNGNMSFSSKKAVVRIKILGRKKPFTFHKRDKVAFRLDNEALLVEDVKRQRCRMRIPLGNVEHVLAGEPETNNKNLFQG